MARVWVGTKVEIQYLVGDVLTPFCGLVIAEDEGDVTVHLVAYLAKLMITATLRKFNFEQFIRDHLHRDLSATAGCFLLRSHSTSHVGSVVLQSKTLSR